MDTLVLAVKEIDQIKPEIKDISEQVQATVIATIDDYAMAAEFTRRIKERYSKLEEMRKQITKPLDQAKKGVMDLFRVPSGLLTNSEIMLKTKMLKYQRDQEKIRKAQEEKLRIETEKEKTKLLKKAEKIIETKPEKADELRQQAEELVPPTFEQPETKLPGLSTRTIWKADVFDQNIVPHTYMIPNQKMLDEIARASKGLIKVPGVRFHSEEVMAVR